VQTAVTHLRETQALAKRVGESPALLKTIEQLPAIAESDVTVLTIGEASTGKELVALAFHYLSNRASFPFGLVNCRALLDTLFEDELFGHERGAFMGAHTFAGGDSETCKGARTQSNSALGFATQYGSRTTVEMPLAGDPPLWQAFSTGYTFPNPWVRCSSAPQYIHSACS